MDEKKRTIPRMTEEELKQFVLGVADGRIFLGSFAPEDLVGSIFMPLFLGALEGIPLESLGMVWEYNNKALPRCINGYPMFTSCRMMHKDDWKRAFEAINKEKERRESIEV